jgi:lysophospholipase L1-like esterase
MNIIPQGFLNSIKTPLNPLTLTTPSVVAGSVLKSYIQGQSVGSTLSITTNPGNKYSLISQDISVISTVSEVKANVIGPAIIGSTSTSVGTETIVITETLIGSQGSPKNTSISINMSTGTSASSVAFFGDSITYGVGVFPLGNVNLCWSGLVTTALGAVGLNQGLSGTVLQNSIDSSGSSRASNGRNRFVSALLGVNKKNKVYILYGFNDARYIAAPDTLNVSNYTIQYKEILSGLIIGGYDISDITIGTPWYINSQGLLTGSTGFAGQSRSKFEEYVAAVIEVATEFGVNYANVYLAGQNAFAENGTFNTADYIHPNYIGHALIANTMLAASPVNTNSKPASLTANSNGQHLLAVIPPVASATGYEFQYGTEGTYSFNNSVVLASTSTYWTNLSSNSYRVRARAVFSGSTYSPWVFAASSATTSLITSWPMSDSFTGTGTSITSETGNNWTLQTGYSPVSPALIDTNNRLYSVSTNSVYQSTSIPLTPDYYVEGGFVSSSNTATDVFFIAGRMQSTSDTYYYGQYTQSDHAWKLFSRVNGISTQLGSSYTGDNFISSNRVVRLSMIGSTISLRVSPTISSSTAIIVAQVTDVSIPSAGAPGFGFLSAQSITTGIHLDAMNTAILTNNSSSWPAIDNFIDIPGSKLLGHISDTGNIWSSQPCQGIMIDTPYISSANRVYGISSSILQNSAIPPSADYYVEAVFYYITLLSTEIGGIAGRMQSTSHTLYFCRYSASAAGWQLFKTVLGVSTQLGATIAATVLSGDTYTVRLTMIGTTISVSVNSVTIISVTDSSITTAGFAGIRLASISSDTTGLHIDSFTTG